MVIEQSGDFDPLHGKAAPGTALPPNTTILDRVFFMVNLPRGQEVSGLHGVRSLFAGAIPLLVRLNGLSVAKSRVQRARERLHAQMSVAYQVQLDSAGHVIDFVPRQPVETTNL